ncbi:MAG: L,D-transpeptidase [Pseudomonadota bacterium]
MSRSISVAAVAALVTVLSSPVTNAQGLNWETGDWIGSSAKKNSIQDRKVVNFPSGYSAGQIIVSFSDRRLYHVVSRGRAISYPIAVPRPQSRWDGVERVSYKRVEPTWTPTARMRRENPKLPRVVPGGHPRNPMGSRAIYLGNTLYRIHGTDAPWTIGQNVSRGCIRMHNAHVEELYKQVRPGMKVTSTYRRFRTRTVTAQSSEPADLFSLLGFY